MMVIYILYISIENYELLSLNITRMHDLDGVEPRMSSPLAEFPNQDYLFEDLVVT